MLEDNSANKEKEGQGGRIRQPLNVSWRAKLYQELLNSFLKSDLGSQKATNVGRPITIRTKFDIENPTIFTLSSLYLCFHCLATAKSIRRRL